MFSPSEDMLMSFSSQALSFQANLHFDKLEPSEGEILSSTHNTFNNYTCLSKHTFSASASFSIPLSHINVYLHDF